ncbi:hypothetical protein TNCV_2695271 [Trichonephila clavipes]|nr:hypothetical protein TNCV_2695271 [Trichonephila clavipes]
MFSSWRFSGSRFSGHDCSHPRVPRARQAGLCRCSLAGVGLSESVRCHGPVLELLTNGGVQQQQKIPFTKKSQQIELLEETSHSRSIRKWTSRQ